MNALSQTHFDEAVTRAGKRPPFRLSTADLARLAEVETMCRNFCCNPAASIDLELELMHQDHCYRHRPILGVANSLNTIGDRAFSAEWAANRVENMAEAYAEWESAKAPEPAKAPAYARADRNPVLRAPALRLREIKAAHGRDERVEWRAGL